MNDYVNFNVSRDVLDAMISAKSVSDELLEMEVSTLDFIIASLTFPTTKLFTFLEENNEEEYLEPETILMAIMGDKKTYEEIFEESYEDFVELKGQVSQPLNIVLQDEKGKQVASINTFSLTYSMFSDYSQEFENALIKAGKMDKLMGNECIDMDTLIYCILANKDSLALKLLRKYFNTKGLMPYLKKNSVSKECLSLTSEKLPENMKEYVDNLNEKYSNKKDCDILGRDEEIFQVWNIISKKTKRNPILVGEPGVGKSAIVEAITHSIVNQTCPKEFRNYTVYSLNLNSMVAGTKYRGEFEQKTQELISFVENTSDVIIFLDEIHHLLGTGSAEGSGPDLAGSLKPLLARDNVVFIGATTTDEYNRIFARDGALSRRFEKVVVKEPKFNEVKPMITAKVESLSSYHKVKVSEDILDNILICASSFSNVANPDRTIDLLDKSLAVAKMSGAKELKVEHIRKVYKKNFDIYQKTPINQKRATAYHEAGHFAAWYLSKTKINEECILISIVPAEDWLGVNFFEESEIQFHKRDMNYLKESVSINLAGRVAQSFVSKEIDAGASSDLEHATTEVENFIMKCGMNGDYLNYSFDSKSELSVSDNTSDDIRKKAKEFINETYKYTEELLSKNKASIDNVAKLLMKKGIITKEEAINAFKEGKVVTKRNSKKTKAKVAEVK